MKKQLIIIGIAVILLTGGFVGLLNVFPSTGNNKNNNIIQSNEEKIIGAWIYSFIYNNNTLNASYIFSSNKKLEIVSSYINQVYTENGTWSITDNKLLMNLEGQDTITLDYEFSNDNTKLIITDSSGNVGVFTKQ